MRRKWERAERVTAMSHATQKSSVASAVYNNASFDHIKFNSLRTKGLKHLRSEKFLQQNDSTEKLNSSTIA